MITRFLPSRLSVLLVGWLLIVFVSAGLAEQEQDPTILDGGPTEPLKEATLDEGLPANTPEPEEFVLPEEEQDDKMLDMLTGGDSSTAPPEELDGRTLPKEEDVEKMAEGPEKPFAPVRPPLQEEEERVEIPDVDPANFRVREFEGDLELGTPWGTYVIPGRFGTIDNYHYKIAIPMKDLILKSQEREDDEIEEPEDKLPETIPPKEIPPALTELPLPKPEQIEQAKTEPEPKRELASTLVRIDDTDRLIVEANRLYNQRRYYESLSVVDKILRIRPDHTRAWLMRGSLLLVQGHKDLALKSWEQASKLSPEDPEVQAVLKKYK